MPRDYVKLYAPYVFLTEGANGAGEFDLFVCIPYKIGETVAQTDLSYSNGKTFLQFSISGQGGRGNQTSRFFKRVSLNPAQAAKADGYTFDESRFSVEVSTMHQQVTHTIQVFYRDKNTEVLPSEQIAFDSPYLYLVNPHEVNGNRIYEYIPYCLVPLKNFDQGNPLVQTYSEDEDSGECQQEIVLSALVPGTPSVGTADDPNGVSAAEIVNYREVVLEELKANKEYYRDAQQVEGGFEVIVNYPVPGTKKRKGRLTNASSDQNPIAFNDSFFD